MSTVVAQLVNLNTLGSIQFNEKIILYQPYEGKINII